MSASGSSEVTVNVTVPHHSPRQLRIVHCFRSPVGGIFRHVRDLTEAQVAAGHLVGVVCNSTTGGAHEERLFEEITPLLALGVRRTPMQRQVGAGDIATAWRSYRIIKELQPDVLHGHGAKGGVYARAFGSLLRVSRSRVARLYSPHGGSLHYDEKSAKGKLFFGLEHLMERFTDQLLFVSDYERLTYIRKVGKPRVPNGLVYNGLRDNEFEPVHPSDQPADFLYIGMMRDLKGPDLFIDALADVARRLNRSVSAVMVGDGDDLPSYRAQVERLGLASQVRFMAPMPARQAFALAKLRRGAVARRGNALHRAGDPRRRQADHRFRRRRHPRDPRLDLAGARAPGHGRVGAKDGLRPSVA